VQTVVTSGGQNDSGLFELSLRDDRYLPFEGAGAISSWHLDLDPDTNAFDFDTIADVILHVRYTARDGGEDLRTAAKAAAVSPGGARLFSAETDFPSAWYQFLHPADPAGPSQLQLDLSQARFPYQLRDKAITISQIDVFLKLNDHLTLPGGTLAVTLSMPGSGLAPVAGTITPDPTFNGLPHATFTVAAQGQGTGVWTLQASLGSLADGIDDLFILCRYTAS
jgi:hypothetical protein